jgi:3',5'-cyclic AMP phosphodiesterase CpdA
MARAFLESLGPPHDVTLVPGNHDAYVSSADRYREEHWGDYMHGDNGATGELSFPFVRRRGQLALIGLSTAAPSPPFLATGQLGRAQLARLGAALDSCAGLFRVVLIHHPPVSKPSRRFKRLLDGGELRMALARHGAELVIHGHDHERARIDLEGPGGPRRTIPVIGVPSASEAPPGKHDPAGYNLYWIEGTSGAWRCEMVSRGLTSDGADVAEIERTVLVGN